MSARDKLVEHIAGLNKIVCGEFCGSCECAVEDAAEANALIDALLREHAKELAEKIRGHIGDVIKHYGIGYIDGGYFRAADLIDPDEEAS
ncbi:hypothetical protein [Streptomyces hydrogenans]|uniref:hypothetical protein n=1 Tax=Streptomyces hydrogenans TaxID=1873719 RepID=UPI0035DD014D